MRDSLVFACCEHGHAKRCLTVAQEDTGGVMLNGNGEAMVWLSDEGIAVTGNS